MRAVNYSKVARSTTVTSRVLPNGALLRTLGASLIYSTVGDILPNEVSRTVTTR